MVFTTHIQGIPCQCQVLQYSPGLPEYIYGAAPGEALPADPPEFEYQLLDRSGYAAPWLETKVTTEDETRLLQEYLYTQTGI